MTERQPANISARMVVSWMLLGGIMIGVSASDVLPNILVWNASESVPVGLHHIEDRVPVRGNLVLVQLPKWVTLITSQRNYLLPDLPALKLVSALSGDEVCRLEDSITINGSVVATAYLRDRLGRRMPVWLGCRTLKADEVFLLTDHPNSFDGRYFGVTKKNDVIGVAMPIWIKMK